VGKNCQIAGLLNKQLVTGFLIVASLLTSLCGCEKEKVYTPANGDIVFQISRSTQSRAIQLATHSQYSHMGIVYIENEKPYVFEAVEPVKSTPLSQWIARGEDGHFVAKRLAHGSKFITKESAIRMIEVGSQFKGKGYDLYFEWSDERIYCSELVWKLYQRALDIELCGLESFSDFDLSSPEVQTKIRERWGSSLPTDEPMVSPAAIYNSELLVEIHRK
jgi:hypothetical protein